MPSSTLITSDDDDDLGRSLELRTQCLSPPLDSLPSRSPTPFDTTPVPSLSYLMALLTAPDMAAYIHANALPESVYQLPMPLVSLLIQVREEYIYNQQMHQQSLDGAQQHSALDKLRAFRDYLMTSSNQDMGAMMVLLRRLINDDAELSLVLGT
ncbi:hypothetical protein BC940DRAFT_332451 [Gongronella butleri]|nr:hypothetical protein BC940DRAFT_332451 [Gongronella butleri]